MRRLAVLSILCLCLSAPSHAAITEADILAYNTALQAGDTPAILAASLQLANAAVADKDNPEADVAAFEAAWTLCRLGACEEALPAAKFAAGQPGAGAQEKLLAAFAAWKVQPSLANVRDLQAALGEVAPHAPSGLSVSAFRELYGARLLAANYAEAGRLARQAQAHFAIGGQPFQQFEIEARAIGITSRFNTSPRIAYLEEMVHLRGELSQMRRAAGRDRPDWIDDAYWRANAWQSAMQAFFASTSDRRYRPARLDAILAEYATDQPVEARDDAGDEAPVSRAPFCEGSFVQEPPMRYPSAQGMRGRFGSVIIRFRFEDGRVRDPEVLAAVPFEGFREQALQTVSQWYFRPSEDPSVTGCRLDRRNVVQEIIFSFG